MTRNDETHSGGGIAGSIGAGLLTLLGGVARQADDVGRVVFTQIDDLGRVGISQMDDVACSPLVKHGVLVRQFDEVDFRPFTNTGDDALHALHPERETPALFRGYEPHVESLPTKLARDAAQEAVENLIDIGLEEDE